MNHTKKLGDFLKQEAVLIISALLALLSTIAVPPDRLYRSYIDWHTLALLFSLMVVVSGLSEHQGLKAIAYRLIALTPHKRGRAFALVALSFFSSMLITNDVALITFVPLTIISFTAGEDRSYLLYTIILETVAANVGSALTPVGNPQNLFLYNHYNLDFLTMATAMAPYVGGGALLLLVLLAFIPKKREEGETAHPPQVDVDSREIMRYSALFVVAILAVFRVVPVFIALAAIILLSEKRLLKSVDYSLLATFVALFVLVGNLGRLEMIEAIISAYLEGREFLLALILSQIVSNVPATLLLAQFSDNAIELLRGVNAGGCGTLIASMASVISFRFYVKSEPGRAFTYLLLFTLVNILFTILFITIHTIS